MKRMPGLHALALIVLSTLVPAPDAGATTLVQPTEQVATRLHVREYPSGADTVAVVGKLLKNETAVLVDSVPYWYRIRLDNDVEGYVSKAWSDTLSAAGPDEIRVRLGAWNIKKLGHGAAKDYATVARVIEANFDVVVIVEVMQKEGTHAGYDRMLQHLGHSWQGVVTDTPRPNTTSGWSEFYAILYRPEMARIHAGWPGLRFYTDNDGGASGTGADDFSREPAYTYLEIQHPDGTVACDFVIGVYHATWSGGSSTIISEEVAHIDAVLAEMTSAVDGEGDVWLLGDFNLRPDRLAALTAATDIVVGTGSTLNSAGQRTANLYDHILVHDPTASGELVGDGRVLDVREATVADDVFYGSVSDHLPVVVELHTTVDDD